MNIAARISGGATALLTALFVVVASSAPVSAETEEADEQSSDVIVEITPDRDGTLSPGDEVVYTVEVTNSGEPLEEARIVQMLPAGFEHVDSEPEGQPQGNQVAWTTDLDTDETLTFDHTVRAGEAEQVEGGQLVEVEQPDAPDAPDEDEKQFSSTACVYEASGSEALVCTSAYQQLDRDPGIAAWVLWITGGAAAVLLAVVGFLLWRRGRSGQEQEQELTTGV